MSEATAAAPASRRALPPLLVPVAVLVAVLVAAVFAVRYSEGLVDQAKARLRADEQALSDARRQHSNAGAEKELIVRNRGAYAELQDSGFVGAEQRVNWVDGLRTANRDVGLFGVEYQVSQQETYPNAADVGGAGLPMKQSLMKLTLPLLHEADLGNFLRTLAAQRNGIFVVDACTLKRAGSSAQPSVEQPNLSAECELAWITVSDAEAEQKEP
ncbi:MAG: hypothetical protein MUF30_07155 [Burkholderiales bacterium]|jgi:hypothetical protein|nr:hypothetical protein [Burkholderiales bacterium]